MFGAEFGAPALDQSARKYVFDPLKRVASFVGDEGATGLDAVMEGATTAVMEADSAAAGHTEGAADACIGHWETVKDEESGCNYYARAR